MEYHQLLEQASQIIESREKYQRVLGQLASEIADKYGMDKLEDFSRDIKETYGLSVAPGTLRNYRWVWDKTHGLDLPADLSYRTLQYIASSGKPEHWAKRIKEEGLTSPEVYRLLRKEKGLDEEKTKTVICKNCGAEVEV